MRIAFKELIRQPGRFASVGGALTLLVVLLVVLGGFLDGLELSQTGPYRAHEGRQLVFSEESELLIQRSRVDGSVRRQIADLDGVTQVGGLNSIQTTASDAGDELVDIVLFGYELPTDVIPPPPAGEGAIVDSALADRNGVKVGDQLAVGPTSEPVTITEIVDDLTLASPTVWVSLDRWRRIVGASNPAALPPENASQIVVVQPSDQDAAGLRDVVIAGVTFATPTEVIDALPVVQQQSSTFRGIIGVTFVVTLLVVALFFALITLERVDLYAVLKALGARTLDLVAGVSVQALGVSVVALLLGFSLSGLFVLLLPANLPVRVEPARLVQIAVGVLATGVIGSLFTLRRLLKIDPAEAIG